MRFLRRPDELIPTVHLALSMSSRRGHNIDTRMGEVFLTCDHSDSSSPAHAGDQRGVMVVDGEDCAVGEDELLHAATIRTMARTEVLICRLERRS